MASGRTIHRMPGKPGDLPSSFGPPPHGVDRTPHASPRVVAGRWSSHLRTRHAATLGLLVAAFIAVTLLEMSLRPIYEAPDEISHLHYAQMIANHAALPGAGIHERQQPPLYYLVSAGLLKVGLGLTGMRLLSLLCGLLTLMLCALVAREIWPARPWLWILAAAIVAAIPEVQYLAGAATNESLSWTVGALLVLLCLRVLRSHDPVPSLVLWCGAVAGLAAITREEDWVLAALLIGTMIWRWRVRLLSRTTAVAVILAVLICGWWFARNLLTFHTPLPPETPLAAVGPHTLRNLAQLRSLVSQLILGLAGTYGDGQHEVHGALGGLSAAFKGLCLVLVAALVLGCIAVVVRRWRDWPPSTRALAVVLALAPVLLLAAVVLNSAVVDLQPQTRYMFSALPAYAVATIVVGRAAARALRGRAAVVAVLAAGAAVAVLLDAGGVATAASLPPFHGQAVPDKP
jgi:4-amino-4-deoxy-L-arabinose transferase-like glycosyltransferase